MVRIGASEVTAASPSALPFDQRWLEEMIAHHQTAIAMAQAAQTQFEHPQLAHRIGTLLTARQAEVYQMQKWLAAWYEAQPPVTAPSSE